jgi:hypothetical protein
MKRTITAVVAAAAIVGLSGCAVAKTDQAAAAASKPAATAAPADVQAKTEELAGREAVLDTRLAQLDRREKDLDAREAGIVKSEKVEKVAAAATFGEGTYLVGEDIKPGTYRTSGPTDDNCYWARRSGTSGSFSELITNGNPAGPTTVTIKSSDAAFETSGCGDWTRR